MDEEIFQNYQGYLQRISKGSYGRRIDGDDVAAASNLCIAEELRSLTTATREIGLSDDANRPMLDYWIDRIVQAIRSK